MKNIHKHTLRLALIMLCCSIWLEALPQNTLVMAGTSAGTTTDKSANGTYNLYSVVGQPAAYSSSVPSELHAGFMQVVSFIIPDATPPVIPWLVGI